jgi:hypothetical protein
MRVEPGSGGTQAFAFTPPVFVVRATNTLLKSPVLVVRRKIGGAGWYSEVLERTAMMVLPYQEGGDSRATATRRGAPWGWGCAY